jgi:hypothetical protein
VPGLLESAARIVQHDGPVEGFRHMNNAGRIKHLGSAFFTKWLYFASATTSADDPSVQEVGERRVETTVQKQPPPCRVDTQVPSWPSPLTLTLP